MGKRLGKKEITNALFYLVYYDGIFNPVKKHVRTCTCEYSIETFFGLTEGLFPYDLSKINLLTGEGLAPYHVKETDSFNDEIILPLIELSEEKETPIEIKDISTIIEMHEPHKGNLSDAVKESNSNYSWFFTKVIWNLDGLPILFNGINVRYDCRNTYEEIYRILESYNLYKRDISEAWNRLSDIDIPKNKMFNLWKQYHLINNENKIDSDVKNFNNKKFFGYNRQP